MKNAVKILFIVLLPCSLLYSCKKGFLEVKPQSNIVVPSNLEDLQRLLDNSLVNSAFPGLGQLSSDEYYYTYTTWQSYPAIERNLYIWTDNVYQDQSNNGDWNSGFQAIYYANAVLDGLNNVEKTSDNSNSWDNVKGGALFHRANRYAALLDVFTLPYEQTKASELLGLPIRTTADVSQLKQRSTLKETYDFVIKDLKNSIPLLPVGPGSSRVRASKAASFALLARIYLNMKDYSNAKINADSSLLCYNKLINYNTLSTTTNTPFSDVHDEMVMYDLRNIYDSTRPGYIRTTNFADPTLYSFYGANDLRKIIFFLSPNSDGTVLTKALYNSRQQNFGGIAVDEVYLIKAECLARANEVPESLSILNALLINRWKSNTFIPFTVSDSNAALQLVLLERRKELISRGFRWSDVRRLNTEGANITLRRNLNGIIYELSPNSNKYALLIPPDEINSSGIQQNIR
ncbi:hypothetical protein HDC92_002488 [Pedobacter sp. AK017]|uniref:RagB/SusD family nutrient uptake outer membrane protein n=1 Tax=Pedobacter sp. AK017 TaxID=2723073 RepID=UPI00161B033E|nr:RagB/SusD family nutrient uptake outer membrane protein [Pedobacter sp. AK017]MBB5438807.1 hypothetical protein [Pedobacter sp. AK017]